MAGLIPAIHVVKLCKRPNAQPNQDPAVRWTTWMAGASPRIKVGVGGATSPFIHQGWPKAGANLPYILDCERAAKIAPLSACII